MVEHLFVVATYHKKLERRTDLRQAFDVLHMVGVAHAAAHQQDGFLIRVNAELCRRVLAGQLFVEFRVHRNAERQDAVLRNAALHTAVGEQFTRGDDVLHARHILPVRVERVVGNNADGLDIGEFFALFQLIDHLCGKNVRTDDNIGHMVRNDLGKLGRTECVDDIDNARRRVKIACAVVLGQLVDQTVQRLHVLGGEQIALVDGGFDQVADIGVNIQRVNFRALGFQHVADGLCGGMVTETGGDG